MSDLDAQLEAARAEVARIEREIAAGPCWTHGHTWTFLGGANAGCCDTCNCSVSVHVCAKCGDCDYGVNEEAVQIRKECETRNG
ncbi:MAG: hypothetical protein J0H31_07850 [Alphaproteobacteria bacterium]|nr:hypothetical protein [Alphaproteobacteria bacterium]